MNAAHGRRGFRLSGNVTWAVVATLVATTILTGIGWAASGLVLTRTGPAAEDGEVARSDAQWTGMVQGSQRRVANLVSSTYTMSGDFWFTVNEAGKVRGYANVIYEPVLNLTTLDATIKYARDTGNAAMGLLTGGPMLALGTKINERGLATYTDVIGIPKQVQTVQSGPIHGELRRGRLSLQWAEDQATSLPFTIKARFLKSSQTIGGDMRMPIEPPWPNAGRVSNKAGLMVSSVHPPEKQKSGDVKITTSSSWTAHRVGG